MKRIEATGEISTIIIDNETILYGTYHHENDDRTGGIFINDTLQLETSGTFQIEKYKNSIFAANSKDFLKIDQKVTKIETNAMNTSFCFDKFIYVTQSNGYVTIYDQNLCIQKSLRICEGHILWCVNKIESYLLCGCDCGNFVIYDMRNFTRRILKRSSGITSIFIHNCKIYVGGYDGLIIIYDLNFEEISRNEIGNVWRMVSMEENLVLACMYEGIKIVNEELKVLQTHKTNSIAYGLDYKNKILVFSDFYEKCYYKTL